MTSLHWLGTSLESALVSNVSRKPEVISARPSPVLRENAKEDFLSDYIESLNMTYLQYRTVW